MTGQAIVIDALDQAGQIVSVRNRTQARSLSLYHRTPLGFYR
jgi:hypothetical protein